MNVVRRVWLPPDGDHRLTRFQEELTRTTGQEEWSVVPAHLELATDRAAPVGWVSLGPWTRDGRPTLEAWDALGLAGVFWLGTGLGPLSPVPEGLVGPPGKWTRGRVGFLDLTVASDGEVVLWTWRSLRGWKPDPTKESVRLGDQA